MLQSSSEQSQQPHSRSYSIGPFYFSHRPNTHLRRTLRHLYRNFTPRIELLRIQNGRLNELLPKEALDAAEKFQVERLLQFNLENNKLASTSFLLKCTLDNLQVLNLSRNKLISLQDIGKHLHFPQLQKLLLCNNQLVRLRGIRKADLPMLNKLAVELNYLSELGELAEAHFPSLTQLQLYSNNIADLRPLFKLNYPKLEILTLRTYMLKRRKYHPARSLHMLKAPLKQVSLPEYVVAVIHNHLSKALKYYC